VSTSYDQRTEPRPTRLERSRDDRVISGVAAGIARYLGVDPVVVRLTFVVLALAGGGGVFAYLVAWLIVPEALPADGPPPPPDGVWEDPGRQQVSAGRTYRTEPSVLVGLVLVALGAGLLIERIVPGFSWRFAGPALLVALGVLLVSRGRMGR
jgi:phage shock protein C